ncbi:MFS transporter [Buchnera aphidicola (Kurisakia onigurumii)]|uniref:MFS transporter n=1 Tax=Buchnera aphidicola TaxID=9 RepID=UPI0031B6A801
MIQLRRTKEYTEKKENIQNNQKILKFFFTKVKNSKFINKNTKEFNKVIFSLFLAGFSTFSILYCVQPILPIFSQKFHLNTVESGLSLSVATFMMAVGMLFSGFLSDYFGRKIVMSVSLIISSLLTILCFQMDSWMEIILMRSLIGLTLSGVVGVAMSYLSEEIHPKVLGFTMGLYISGNTIGGLFGRVLSGFTAHYFSWEIAFFIVGIVSFFSSITFIYLLPSSKNFFSSPINQNRFLNNIFTQCRDSVLSVLFIIGFTIMGSFITLFNYITYRLMTYPFHLNQMTIASISLIYLTGVYTSPKAGTLISKYGRKNILIISLLSMIFGVLITQLNFTIFIVIGLIIFSSGFFAAHSVSSSWIGVAANKSRGQAASLYLFFYYLGSSVCSTLGGLFWYLGHWLGISIFIIFLLILGIKLISRLKNTY